MEQRLKMKESEAQAIRNDLMDRHVMINQPNETQPTWSCFMFWNDWERKHTHLKRNTDLTGNHNRIAPINSPGKMVAARVAFLIIFLCQLVRVSNGMTPSSVHQSYSRRVRCKKINSRRVQMFHTPWVRMSLSYLIFFF